MFANSPFTEGKPNGFLSFRSEIWRDTDPDRSGMLPWAFEPGMGFERYVDYALDVPMYFVKRGDQYIDVAGQVVPRSDARASLPGCRASARRFPTGRTTSRRSFRRCGSSVISKCAAPTAGRGGGCRRLPAYWVGILYDDDALDAAWDLVKDWTARGAPEDCATTCRSSASQPAIAGRNVLELAKMTLALAEQGLARRRRFDALRPRREPLSAPDPGISSRAASRRRRSCWKNSRASGTAVWRPCSRHMLIDY